MPTFQQGNASHWRPSAVNPPCTCPGGHDHHADENGLCDVPNDNNPESWGYCPCQYNDQKPLTMDKYEAWQRDILAGRLGPDDNPDKLGFSY